MEKECIQTRMVSHQRRRECWTYFRFAPSLTLKMFRQKETPIGNNASITLNYRNVAKHIWREPQIIKFENAFHIWINIGYFCERTHTAMSRVRSRFRARLTDWNLQSQLHCAVTPFQQNFTKLVPDSIRYFYYWWADLFISINVII